MAKPMIERELPLFPLKVVLFPGMRLPLHIFEERYKLMIGTCMVTDQTFGVALIRTGSEVGGPAIVYPVGTTARVLEVARLPEGQMNLVVIGADRFRLLHRLEDRPYAVGQVRLLPDREDEVLPALVHRVSANFRRYLAAKGVGVDQADRIRLPDHPLALSYLVAAALKIPTRQRQRLLEDPGASTRLRRELALMEMEIGGPGELIHGSFSLN